MGGVEDSVLMVPHPPRVGEGEEDSVLMVPHPLRAGGEMEGGSVLMVPHPLSVLMVVRDISGTEELYPDHSSQSNGGAGGRQRLRQVHHCQTDSEAL